MVAGAHASFPGKHAKVQISSHFKHRLVLGAVAVECGWVKLL